MTKIHESRRRGPPASYSRCETPPSMARRTAGPDDTCPRERTLPLTRAGPDGRIRDGWVVRRVAAPSPHANENQRSAARLGAQAPSGTEPPREPARGEADRRAEDKVHDEARVDDLQAELEGQWVAEEKRQGERIDGDVMRGAIQSAGQNGTLSRRHCGKQPYRRQGREPADDEGYLSPRPVRDG